jgi:Fic family protein
MQLARADKSKQRFYSMSAQIQANRDKYYDILETTRDLDITAWLKWFLNCLLQSMAQTDETIAATLKRAQFGKLIVIPTLTFVSKKNTETAFDDFFLASLQFLSMPKSLKFLPIPLLEIFKI